MTDWSNATTIPSLLIKLTMLAVTAALILWIGWPIPKNPANDSPLQSHEQMAGSQDTERVSGLPRAFSDPTGEAQRTNRTHVTPVTIGAKRLDINRATVEELQALPGIGEVLARRVVARRTERGSFNAIEDLLEVKGIGQKRLNSLRSLIRVGNQTGTPHGTTKPAEAPPLEQRGRL